MPTVTALSEAKRRLLERYLCGESRKDAAGHAHIGCRPPGESVPLSFSQQQVWLHAQMAGEIPFYNETMTVYRQGPLDLAVLHRCFLEIIRRHEIWRTTFDTIGGEPVQIIHPSPHVFLLPMKDLRSLPVAEREAEARRLATSDARRPFDLKNGPLLRVLVVRMDDERYRLYMTLHHIIFDAVTVYRVFLPELATLYEALSAGNASPLPELSIQYADFAYAQRQESAPEIWSEHLDYWRRQLAGELPQLEWPNDRAHPPIETHRGAIQRFKLPTTLVRALRGLSRDQGVSLYMTLLSAFVAVLHRYTGQDDIIVGSFTAGRKLPETEPLLGYFVNPLALRIDVSGNPSFRELQLRVREVVLDALAHEDVPFAQVVKEVQRKPDPSRNPLFQVVLSQEPQMAKIAPGWDLATVEIDNGGSKTDLIFIVDDRGDNVSGPITYNPDLFDDSTISRMVGHWQTLLAGACTDPQMPIHKLPILTEAERTQLLLEWNDTRADYPKHLCLHQLVEAQAEQTPDATALVYERNRLTYRELNARANQLAHHLRRRGIGPDALVGICMERSIEMVVGLLGIIKAGGAYLPLDPDYPKDRLRIILEDSRVPILLTQHGLLTRLPASRLQLLCLDTGWEELAGEMSSNPECVTRPENLAYVIYTSGSTGRPKGVLSIHAGIVNRLLWMQDRYHLRSDDRVLQKTPYSFDVSVWEFFWPLLTGACLVMAKPGGHKDSDYLVEVIRREKITTLHFVPSMLRVFLEASGLEACSSLKRVICSGEALPFEVQKRFFASLSAELHNLYGPTEAAVDVTHWQCQPECGGEPVVPIGRPIANVQIYLLDRNLQPVPVGIAGELHIGGVALARGYLHRPELTAEKFIPDPFSGEPGARLYKTGDLARYRPDGNIEFVGRIDGQVKIRGFRIELGEIEAMLNMHPGIRQSVAIAREDLPGDKQLVAYFEAQPGQPPSASDLRAHLEKNLPGYMIPSAFVAMEKLPLTPNGKIDRKSLPAPEQSITVGTKFIAPQGPHEQMLAHIWANILKQKQVGRHDNFFELGGHSLLAIQAVSRIRDMFGADVAVQALFENPTIAGLATALTATKDSGTVQRIERRKPSGVSPLSFAQEQLWFLYQLTPGSSVYNISDYVDFHGKYDAEAMRRAIRELVRRHEILRTTFSDTGRQPVQVISPEMDLPLADLDLSPLSEQEREREWTRVLCGQGRKPFDLSQAPLFRATMVHLSAHEHRLLLTTHHILVDEWSMEVVHQEVKQLYEAFSEGRPSPLPELAIQYADFSCWQRNRLQGEVLKNQTSYWKEELAGASFILELPTDKPRPAIQNFRGATETLQLPRKLLEQLKALGRQQQATLFMILEAGFMALLHRYTGQNDILVGTPISSRTYSETERLIGLFLNTVLLRAKFSERQNFLSLLQDVRERALGAYAHPDLPFAQLVAELAPAWDVSRTPLFQVMFILHNSEGVSQVSKVSGDRELETGTSKFDLTLVLSENENGLDGLIEYSTDLFEATTIRRLASYYARLLEAIAADPDRSISALSMFADTERQQLLVDWNNTTAEFPGKALCLHQLVEAQVQRTPDAAALVCEQDRLSYRELNARANQLAHHLRRRGVGPDVLVGICIERSIEMVVGLLAIMKAGGAYLPLDPDYPKERLRVILEDGRISILLTRHSLLTRLPASPVQVLCLDTDWDELSGELSSNPECVTCPENLAYVIYTSGSTGRPKGVLNVHAGIVNRLSWMQDHCPLTSEDRVLQKTPYTFDVSICEFFAPLISGACLVMARPGGHKDSDYLLGIIQSEKITSIHFVPSMLRVFLEANGLEACTSLKRVICSGEPLPFEVQKRFFARSASELHNLYGPTEAAVEVTHWQCQPDHAEPVVPIGHPIANVQIYLLDRNLQPVPIGIPGELHIGGVALARGYLNRPELTGEKFIPNPFSSDPGARLYKTGDLARYRADGNIEFVGRIDDQVKIRGFRIELGEIEAVLHEQPAVNHARVIVREDLPGDRRLVAYIVPVREPAPLVEICDYLKDKLPSYMIPVLVTLRELPLTPNGKLDRRALPPPERTESVEAFEAPRDSIELVLAEVWKEVLGLERVGIYDNFVDLGGHSLTALQVVARLRSRLGVYVKPSELAFHTLGQLAAACGERLQHPRSL